jgi:hypothetical protein
MSVPFIPWIRDGLCGAACAHMALNAMGLTTLQQEDVWTSIKTLTVGGDPKLQCTGAVPEEFDTMVREACGSRVACWETFPDALKAALIASLAAGTTVKVRKTVSEETANSNIRKCLNRGGIPIVLVDFGKHWVVVDGWDSNADRPVTILDPAWVEPDSVDLDTWNIDRMAAVDCGKFDRKYVMVEVG